MNRPLAKIVIASAAMLVLARVPSANQAVPAGPAALKGPLERIKVGASQLSSAECLCTLY